MRGKLIRDGKLFGKVSVVDILSVVLVLFLAAVAYLRFSSEDTSVVNRNNLDVTYLLKIASVRDFTTNELKVGDKLYIDEDKEIGEITDIRIENATQLTATMDGEVVKMPVEDRYDVYLTVKAKGRRASGAIYLTEDFEIDLYSAVYIHTKFVTTAGTVISLDVQEAAK